MLNRLPGGDVFPPIALVLALAVGAAARGQAPGDPAAGRVPWATPFVRGTPDPPPPYRVERVFPNLRFRNPVHLSAAAGTDRLFVTELDGLISSFRPAAADRADPFLNLPRDVARCRPGDGVKLFRCSYSLAFHPRFAENRHCYVCYLVETTGAKPYDGLERVSRFTVAGDPPRADPASEAVILEWKTGSHAHNGGCLAFGPDGCLYVSTGDGGSNSPPDPRDTGQDISDLLASVLRIDVDRGAAAGRGYVVPADNPFVRTPGARPEVWAYGLRNPWKMSFDRRTGDLWVGDVGGNLWEMVHRVRGGGNYGWSVMEGAQPVHWTAKRGPTPILPPTLAIPHTEGASVTGGYVYRGKKYPDLVGTYVCGDWMTGRVWGVKVAGDRSATYRELARGRQQVIAFGEDNAGELYYLDYGPDAGVYALVPNDAPAAAGRFPHKLSETGLFASVADHRPAPGVLPYTIAAGRWMDHATADRLVALPGRSAVRVHDKPVPVPGMPYTQGRVFFPPDAVLAKTVSVETERGHARTRRRLETQLLHFDGRDWNGYTYRWNDAQTDADLVPAGGAECELDVRDADAPGGRRRQSWRFDGRGACRQCHNGWAGPPLGFTPEQLDRDGQLDRLLALGAIRAIDARGAEKPPPAAVPTAYRLADPRDAGEDLGRRARSYLHANCAHCHRPGGGGAAGIDLRFEVPLGKTRSLDVPPALGTFGLADARLLAAGDPYRSALYYRMAKTGSGRMPHIGSDVVDPDGLRLIHDWLGSLPGRTGRADPPGLGTVCSGRGDTAAAIEELLATTGGALRLLHALDTRRVPAALRQPVVTAAMNRPHGDVRDLFERFLPAGQRVKRLGAVVRPEAILSLTGRPERGREVFFATAGVSCANCHRVGAAGGAVGPDLSAIGKKYDRAKILESLLDPSKEIDPAYAAATVETADGRLYTGVVVSRGAAALVLRDAQGKETRLPADQVAGVTPQKASLMPDQLLRDLTAQQAADLVDYLASLGRSP